MFKNQFVWCDYILYNEMIVIEAFLKSHGRSSGIQTHDLTHPKGAR